MWRGTTSALNKINGTNFLCSTKADSTCLILTDVKYTLERQLDDSLADAAYVVHMGKNMAQQLTLTCLARWRELGVGSHGV